MTTEDRLGLAPYPTDIYPFDEGDLPANQRPIFRKLIEVATLGGSLYREQVRALEPVRSSLVQRTVLDTRALDPFTVPQNSHFVIFAQHPTIVSTLRRATRLILDAVESAEDIRGLGPFERYLQTCAGYLMRIGEINSAGEEIGYHQIMKEYATLRNSLINFHLLPVEREVGKQMWQGYLGVLDKEASAVVRTDVMRLRRAGAARNQGRWFTPFTEIRVDKVKVMAGPLTGQETRGARLSAMNIPNEPELATGVGTKIIFPDASFDAVVSTKIIPVSARYMTMVPSREGTRRFVAAHEIVHDERYFNDRLGWLASPLRESYANQSGIDLAGEVWDPDGTAAEIFQSVMVGGLGYVFLDCSSVFGRQLDLEKMAESTHMIGSLMWLHKGIEEGAILAADGKVVDINLSRALDLSRRLAVEQRRILKNGNFQDIRGFFEQNLPKSPYSLQAA